MALNKKREAFLDEYFICGMNATEAYSRLYPKATRESARRLGSQLLTNVDISTEIERRLKEKQLSADEVLARLGDMARGDIANFAGIENPSDLLDLEYQGKTHVIKKFKRHVTRSITKDGSETVNEYTELELYDAQSALEKIGRHHKLFIDRTEVSGPDGGPIPIAGLDSILKKAWGNGDEDNSD